MFKSLLVVVLFFSSLGFANNQADSFLPLIERSCKPLAASAILQKAGLPLNRETAKNIVVCGYEFNIKRQVQYIWFCLQTSEQTTGYPVLMSFSWPDQCSL